MDKGLTRVVLIVQARMSSSRLPGKVLKDIAGKPMLEWVVERCRKASSVDFVAVATTMDSSDDDLAQFCERKGYPVYRGNLYDVLDRYYQAAKMFHADVVVRVTGDCPVIDPQEIDRLLSAFFESEADFAANRLPPPWKRTSPIGLDAEVCWFSALERAWKEAVEPFEREHVMPYLYDQDGRFKTFLLQYEQDYSAKRWTVDTPEDLELIRQVFQRLASPSDFSWREVLSLFEKEPGLAEINATVKHKSGLDVDSRMKP